MFFSFCRESNFGIKDRRTVMVNFKVTLEDSKVLGDRILVAINGEHEM